MNRLAIIAAAALTATTFGAAAIAQESTTSEAGNFDNVDANKDQMVSWDEALGAYPTLTQELFNQADENGDGNLDESEFTALEGLTAGLDNGSNTATSSDASSSAQ